MQMTVEETPSGATLVALQGKLDRDGAVALEHGINDIAASRSSVIIDLSKVSYIASMGMKLFLVVGKAMAARGDKMVLMAPQGNVATVLEIAGIHTAIPVCAYMNEALAAVGRRQPS